MNPEAAEYASRNLIAYIGNKRALLPFLGSLFSELDETRPISSFLDPFAGSGAVSRLARTLKWRVMANDIEEYAYVINKAWLGVSRDELPTLFREEDGLQVLLDRINALHPSREGRPEGPKDSDEYIARHYAPANTLTADFRRERLFYTRKNALFLDKARNLIEELRPSASCLNGPRSSERALLLGPLIYEAATHANTSGVFKACHKGYGGHGKDSLGRILADMVLSAPVLWSLPGAEVGKGDAASFCSSRPVDLCYLDPPYNQHQYGSNYHLLNTLARWDKKPVSDERKPDGSLASKAGIPPDWVSSRSDFCSSRKAAKAFRELLSSIDARTIILSYNSEGLVPAAELFDLLSEHATVEIRSSDYVTYRGGKQSQARKVWNSELIFVARRRSEIPQTPGVSVGESLESMRIHLRLNTVLKATFDPRILHDLCDGDLLTFIDVEGKIVKIPTYHRLILEKEAIEICADLDLRSKALLATQLERVALTDNGQACEAGAALLAQGIWDSRLQRLTLSWLRKLAHRKNAARYRFLSAELASITSTSNGELAWLAKGLAELDKIFIARVEGK